MEPDTIVAQVAANVHWDTHGKLGKWDLLVSSYLEKEKCVFWRVETSKNEVVVANKTTPRSEGKRITTDKERETTYRDFVRNFTLLLFIWCYVPKQRSAKFLMRILVTFLLRTEPASMNPNPACHNVINIMNFLIVILFTCIKIMTDPLMMRKKLSRLAATYWDAWLGYMLHFIILDEFLFQGGITK